MNTNAAGLALIKRWESLALRAYLCPAGVWTIGYGHTGDVKKGDMITEHQADAILDVDLDKFERWVAAEMPARCNENQFSACVSFAFNLGIGALRSSTLLKKFKLGDLVQYDAESRIVGGAAHEFTKWNKAKNGKGELIVLAGLTARRLAEQELFLTGAVACG